MSEELVNLTIEGVDVSVPKGTTVLEAAKQAGLVIPHYCYHPSLPVAGVCRMCLVHIEGAPKLQISCATEAAEGQVVSVFSEEPAKARASVLEFLLINHPLDCPICDQAGECELQDYTFQEAAGRSRYNEFAKRFNPVEDFGGDILYVPNRCILCTRCVRFMDHAADEPILNVSERGDRAFIGVHPDADLNHPWAGNVVDLCPVGSLLSKDFLHKARAWELDHTPGICTGCSQGCNTSIDVRDATVVRLRPRPNAEVNKHFICDTGRADYRWMNGGNRLEAPLVAEDGELRATDWDFALARTAQILKGSSGKAVAFVSGRTSNEALFLILDLLREFDVSASFRNRTVPGETPLAGVENLALREERVPNGTGARILGYGDSAPDLSDAAVVFVLDDDLEGIDLEPIAGAANIIYAGTVLHDAARVATVVLPIASVVEEDGSFVNRDDRVQRYFQAKMAPGMARPAWWVLSELINEIRDTEGAATADQVFDRLVDEVGAFAGLSYSVLGTRGASMHQKVGAAS